MSPNSITDSTLCSPSSTTEDVDVLPVTVVVSVRRTAVCLESCDVPLADRFDDDVRSAGPPSGLGFGRREGLIEEEEGEFNNDHNNNSNNKNNLIIIILLILIMIIIIMILKRKAKKERKKKKLKAKKKKT